MSISTFLLFPLFLFYLRVFSASRVSRSQPLIQAIYNFGRFHHLRFLLSSNVYLILLFFISIIPLHYLQYTTIPFSNILSLPFQFSRLFTIFSRSFNTSPSPFQHSPAPLHILLLLISSAAPLPYSSANLRVLSPLYKFSFPFNHSLPLLYEFTCFFTVFSCPFTIFFLYRVLATM